MTKVDTNKLPNNSRRLGANTAPVREVPEQGPKKKVVLRSQRQAVATTARVRKPTFLSRMVSAFIGSDEMSEVGGYLLYDILIPATKKTFEELVNRGISMILYGEARSAPKDDRTYVSYSSMFTGRDRDRFGRIPRRERQNRYSARDTSTDLQARLDDISFVDGDEAADVLLNMDEYLAEFGSVSVANFLEFAGLSHKIKYTDNSYGWDNLNNTHVVTAEDGYYEIDFPRAKYIRR